MTYYLKRLYQLGLYGVWRALKRRFRAYVFAYNNRPVIQDGRLPFYTDITVRTGMNDCLDQMHDDMRLLWEESRLQELPRLAKLFHVTRDVAYVEKFEEMLRSWSIQHPYLFGVQWVCPMEVALRAINILTAYDLFTQYTKLSPELSMHLSTMMRQHADYLYYHDEWSDRPNNHYLADLIGYLYLCSYFNQESWFIRQRDITIRRLCEQWRIQINSDGTSYEGSTAYHRLDTELMYLFLELCKRQNIAVPQYLYQYYDSMIRFMADATDCAGNFVRIGDDDSGFVTIFTRDHVEARCRALVAQQSQSAYVATYKNFGLSTIKHHDWHITFRHPTYQQRQPTGHFHQDALSLTLSVAGSPIIVDPGSYIYTGNGAWRNRFRSWQSHTTFNANAYDAQELLRNKDLFQLLRPQQAWTGKIQQDEVTIAIEDAYLEKGMTYRRCCWFDVHRKLLTISDSASCTSTWQMVIHPSCVIQQYDDYMYKITAPTVIVYLESSVPMNQREGYFSPAYGIKQTTSYLTAQANEATFCIRLNRT